jgi:hypothetical protein
MRGRPDRDWLAVWTYEEAGEQIPAGDPSVTDAERAAADRETLAERFAAVLPDNRERAADRYAAGGLPDGQDVVRGCGGLATKPSCAPVPGCLLADGEAVRWFAPALEAAILAETVPPVLLIGLHNALGALSSRSDLRAQEYLPGPGFRRSTRQWAERLTKAGLPCRHEEWIGGHDQKWWEQQLPVALGWLLRA